MLNTDVKHRVFNRLLETQTRFFSVKSGKGSQQNLVTRDIVVYHINPEDDDQNRETVGYQVRMLDINLDENIQKKRENNKGGDD